MGMKRTRYERDFPLSVSSLQTAKPLRLFINHQTLSFFTTLPKPSQTEPAPLLLKSSCLGHDISLFMH
jgi:hypothetical protein